MAARGGHLIIKGLEVGAQAKSHATSRQWCVVTQQRSVRAYFPVGQVVAIKE
jgi:hypothetical protein